jgi:hypothetical protein
MIDPKQVLHRILDAESIVSGRITNHISVRSDLRDLFESARADGDPDAAPGYLWHATYSYVDHQQPDVVLRCVPVSQFGNSDPDGFDDVDVQITDNEKPVVNDVSKWMLCVETSSRSGKRRLYVVGTWPDGDVKTSSALLTVSDEGVIQTISGSTYKLTGLSIFGQSVSACLAEIGDWVPAGQ